MTEFEFSPDELEAAFNAVADPDDWRAPISALIEPDQRLIQMTVTAVAFFTATVPTLSMVETPAGYMVAINAVGYRAGPAGP